MNNTPDSSQYIHGSTPDEQARLSLLNEILNQSCLRELNPQSGERVLDVGSGLGQFTCLIANAVGPEGYVIGVERDLSQITQARRIAEGLPDSRVVEFRKGDALKLPLHESEWGTFDLAHARFLLEHIPSPALVVAQMIRSVRPGGRVFISDDDHENFRPWPEPPGFPALWQAYIRSYDRFGNDPYIGRRLVALLQERGLTSIRNNCVFFGGCAGNEGFEAIADNLIGVLEGAKEVLLSNDLLDLESFCAGIDGLHRWKSHPSAALWYTVCCAQGVVPCGSK